MKGEVHFCPFMHIASDMQVPPPPPGMQMPMRHMPAQGMPPQSPPPPPPHMPLAHDWPIGQALSHEPQLAASAMTSEQLGAAGPPQQACPLGQ